MFKSNIFECISYVFVFVALFLIGMSIQSCFKTDSIILLGQNEQIIYSSDSTSHPVVNQIVYLPENEKFIDVEPSFTTTWYITRPMETTDKAQVYYSRSTGGKIIKIVERKE